MTFAVGQRWISQTESKLGLGMITEVTHRRVTLSFPAASESRTYATDNPPISRIQYEVNDFITNHDEQRFQVLKVSEVEQLLQYHVSDDAKGETILSEIELSCFIQFTSPLQRIMSGQLDRNRAFRLRNETLEHKHRMQQAKMTGLLGPRTDLLPHQIYIAHTVSNRYTPRVLLADEVGLGKTIEAGMILHAQVQKGQVERALVLVPPSLTHQWLVEMLRKFNLHFALFDEERYAALIEQEIENPFETEQLVLCDQSFLASCEQRQQQAVSAGWDLCIVDEAHHLHWTEQYVSNEYQMVQHLAQSSRGLLLLTATPEQAGIASHFARLHLLDANRFPSLSAFLSEQDQYAAITTLVETLLNYPAKQPLSTSEQTQITQWLGDDLNLDWQEPAEKIVPLIIQQLIDQCGTGRILFRNTRHTVAGFPERKINPIPISPTDQLSSIDIASATVASDPKALWLAEWLKSIRPKKVLVICHNASQAVSLEEWLRVTHGIKSAAFHQDLTLIERDRAAAYFADKESGAQALICSEIGSEGRNFQFTQHLVLFDLPLNPDLLEQRIGRLDRIGQLHDVQIHVPYITGSQQEGLFYWYHQGLDAFTQSCSAGYSLFEQFEAELMDYLNQPPFNSEGAIAFLNHVREKRDRVMLALEKNRDPLLAINSCNAELSNLLIEQIESEEDSQLLSSYMERVFNLYGIEQDHQTDQTVIIRPGTQMLTTDFSGLKAEGSTITYHRHKALAREEVEFLTWEHPMVQHTVDEIITSELGNAALAKITLNNIPAGTLFLEALFSVNCMAPKSLQLDSFLPLSPMRFVVNMSGQDLTSLLPYDKLNILCSGIKRNLQHAVIKEVRDQIPTLLQYAKHLAEQQLPTILSEAKQAFTDMIDSEAQRLTALKQKNAYVNEDDITWLSQQKNKGLAAIERTGINTQAMRLIINT